MSGPAAAGAVPVGLARPGAGAGRMPPCCWRWVWPPGCCCTAPAGGWTNARPCICGGALGPTLCGASPCGPLRWSRWSGGRLQLTGAALVTVYPAGGEKPLTLCLTRQEARQLADQLLPLTQPDIRWRPAGAERWSAALLGANGLSSLALAALALRRSQSLPGAQDLALEQLDRLAALAARWMPAGLAWLLAAATLWYGLNLARAADPCRPAGDHPGRGYPVEPGRAVAADQVPKAAPEPAELCRAAGQPGRVASAPPPLISGGGGLAFGPAPGRPPSGGPAPGGRPAAWVLPAAACAAGPGTAQPHLLPACGDGAGHLPGLSAAVPPGRMPALTAPLLLLQAACGLLLGGGLAGYLAGGRLAPAGAADRLRPAGAAGCT